MSNNTTVTPAPIAPISITKSMEDVQRDTTAEIFTIIQLIYGVPSSILLAVFFVMLCIGKKYSNSFYRLVQFDLLVNLLTYLNSWFAVRMDKHPIVIPFLRALTYQFPGFLSWTRYFAFFFMHMQFLSAIALSLHRISSVFFHSSYEKMWNYFFIPFCFLCILYCCLCNSLIAGPITEVYIRNDTLMSTTYISVITRAMSLNGIFSTIYFILLIVIGLTTSKVVTWKIQAASFTNGGIGKKLNKIAGTYGIIYSGILAWSLINFFNSTYRFLPTVVSQYSANLLPFASDMMTLALPYILMVYDTNVKQSMWQRVDLSRSSSRVVSTSFVISR